MTRRDALSLLGSVKAPVPWSDLSVPTAVLTRPPDGPIVLPDGVTLDPAAARPVRAASAPGRPIPAGTVLTPETLVWARHNGWWRHGVTVGAPSRTTTVTATGESGKTRTVPVVYTPDRTDRLDRHRWPVSELRLRGTDADVEPDGPVTVDERSIGHDAWPADAEPGRHPTAVPAQGTAVWVRAGRRWRHGVVTRRFAEPAEARVVYRLATGEIGERLRTPLCDLRLRDVAS